MNDDMILVSHHLCPYVQRVVISLTEKKVPFRRVNVDLANKPGWFKVLSPLGKTPVLQVGGTAIFDSSVILEYLELVHMHLCLHFLSMLLELILVPGMVIGQKQSHSSQIHTHCEGNLNEIPSKTCLV